MTDDLSNKLAHAVTAYDRKQATKRGYNIYALGLYLAGVDRVIERVSAGAALREAICAEFNDRLCDHILKACGLPLTGE